MASRARDGFAARPRAVYGRAGEAVPALRRARSAGAARASRTARPTGARGASAEPVARRPHGRRRVAPGNTLASFDAALAAGVDMIEFDVLPEHSDGSGRLLLAHDYGAAARTPPLTLEEGLEHLARATFAGVELDVDLKLPGYERRVVEALRAAGWSSAR